MRLVMSRTVLVSLALLPLAISLPAEGAGATPHPDDWKVNDETVAKLQAGKGTLTDSDVLRLLGPPAYVEAEAASELSMTWEAATRIVAVLVDKKTTTLKGEFSPHRPSNKITLSNFKKLRPGMNLAQLTKHIGPRSGMTRTDFDNDVATHTWESVSQLSVDFKDGKVATVSWLRMEPSAARPPRRGK